MSDRRLPVRPDLDQLKHQAKDLLRQIRAGDPSAVEDLQKYHVKAIAPEHARLADAQLVLARNYRAPSWPRLVLACRLTSAIWSDDPDSVRALVLKHPYLLTDNAPIRASDWGPPMTYAANLGRDGIIEVLYELGAKDLESALDRAALQGQTGTARKLHAMLGGPTPPIGCLDGPAYTLSASGTALLFELGASVFNADGKRVAPVDVVLETDSRNPAAKHEILEMYVAHGLTLPDTPTMARHRGRIDLLERHLRLDPKLLSRTFTHEEIYPPGLGCHDEVLATHGTPLGGTTLLHMCMDYDEVEIARWLIDRGMAADARAAVDSDGFGGHTALFATVVSQPNFWMNHRGESPSANLTKLLFDNGANPNIRASLRKKLHPGYGEDVLHEYRNVTPLGWGQLFHRKIFVNPAALELIVQRGGRT